MTTQFYMVASSLPRMDASFKISEPPISRHQLEKRLKLLPEETVKLLFQIELLVWSSWYMPKQSVIETRTLYQNTLESNSDFISDITNWYLDLRSILAAMRMRKTQKESPSDSHNYWVTRWDHQLIQKWNEPDFGLKSVYPWIPKVNACIEKNDTASVEEFLLTHIWNYLSKLEAGHYFDFEAITVYLLRWNIVNYWSQFNKNKVLECIDLLCDSLVDLEHLSLELAVQNKGRER